jgi:hypothetical protein
MGGVTMTAGERLRWLSPDDFLGALGARDLERHLDGPDAKSELFRICEEYLHERNLLVAGEAAETALNELPLRIPKTAIVARISAPTQEELTAVLALAVTFVGSGQGTWQSITATIVTSLLGRLRELHAEYGERSLADAIQGARPPTAENLALFLYGKPCRYPDAGCQFLEGTDCHMGLTQVKEVLEHLVSRNLVRQLNGAEPYRYGLVP